MNDRPLISVVTINLNDSVGLNKTLASIGRQVYKNYEVIIIDGASTDGSIEVIKQYSGIVKSWISEPDNGIYDAMNKGLRLATGRYALFLNSGDVLYSRYSFEWLASLPLENRVVQFKYLVSGYGLLWLSDDSGKIVSHQAMAFPLDLTHPTLFDSAKQIYADSEYINKNVEKYGRVFCEKTFSIFTLGGVSNSISLRKILIAYAEIGVVQFLKEILRAIAFLIVGDKTLRILLYWNKKFMVIGGD